MLGVRRHVHAHIRTYVYIYICVQKDSPQRLESCLGELSSRSLVLYRRNYKVITLGTQVIPLRRLLGFDGCVFKDTAMPSDNFGGFFSL